MMPQTPHREFVLQGDAVRFMTAGALLMLAAVILGAFGAHALQSMLTPKQLASYATGVTYQQLHAIGLVIIGILARVTHPSPWLARAAILFVVGIALFSGSIYAMTFGAPRWLGMVAPIGGTSASCWVGLRSRCTCRQVASRVRIDERAGFLRSGAEEKLFHLLDQELARLRLDGRQAVLVDQHGLVADPGPPGLGGDVVEDALAELTRIWNAFQALGFALQVGAENGSRHDVSAPAARSGERCLRDDDAVVVGVNEFARTESDARKADGHITFAFPPLLAAQRDRAQRPDPEGSCVGEFGGIANAAVNDHAGPAVSNCREAKLVAQQRATARTASIDHEHVAVARAFDRFFHPRIVLEAEDCADRAMKCSAAAVQVKGRLAYLHVLAVIVAEIGRAAGGRGSRGHRRVASSPMEEWIDAGASIRRDAARTRGRDTMTAPLPVALRAGRVARPAVNALSGSRSAAAAVRRRAASGCGS
jgi:uncharacterized membrane protein YgdD (TMEM256/DUF423 family)